MRARSLIFHVIILGTIFGVSALGIWQLQRREWKHNLIAQHEAQSGLYPEQLNALPSNSDAWLWRQIFISGKLDQSKYVFIPKYIDQCEGHHGWGQWVYGLLTLPSGEQVILEVGWQASQKPLPIKTEPFYFFGHDWQAQIAPTAKNSLFIKNNSEKNQWLRVDADMYRAFGAQPQPFYLRMNAKTFGSCADIRDDYSIINFPLELYGRPNLSDNHLTYAITWFALAAVLSALYLYKIRHDKRNPLS